MTDAPISQNTDDLVECPRCQGAGEHPASGQHHLDPRDPAVRMVPCLTCDGDERVSLRVARNHLKFYQGMTDHEVRAWLAGATR